MADCKCAMLEKSSPDPGAAMLAINTATNCNMMLRLQNPPTVSGYCQTLAHGCLFLHLTVVKLC